MSEDGTPIGVYEQDGLPQVLTEFAEAQSLELATFASAEAQVAAISDDIAYNAHDIDDGLRASLFDVIDLADVPLVDGALGEVLKLHPSLDRPRLIHETVRRLISLMVGDVIEASRQRLRLHDPQSADDVRTTNSPIVGFSPHVNAQNRELQKFLSDRMYHHERVYDVMQRAQRVVRDLFETFTDDPAKMPMEWQQSTDATPDETTVRSICDFIAGMTDRYALEQHRQLFDVGPLFR